MNAIPPRAGTHQTYLIYGAKVLRNTHIKQLPKLITIQGGLYKNPNIGYLYWVGANVSTRNGTCNMQEFISIHSVYHQGNSPV